MCRIFSDRRIFGKTKTLQRRWTLKFHTGMYSCLLLCKCRSLKSDVALFWVQVMVIVLGNKTDLRERRQVEHEAAQQWARGEKVKLWEVSVTERTSLIEPFTQLTSRLTQPQSKSAFPLPGRKSKGSPSNDI